MDSFEAIICWKWMRKVKIKIIVPFRSYLTRNRKLKKKQQKTKKYHYGIISSRNRLVKAEKERK